ncbi:hypothetical protein FQN57_003925 [Myotisia sp. PD_48]|nr:hypothetical protein FQN57_003925 [Myotisia sp. PD_48]
MFRRKQSQRSNHAPINPNPSQSAQTAALQAFRAAQPQTPSLSASAAATALRSHTPPPTSVKDVQTKRMLQRQLSDSNASSAGLSGRPNHIEGLRRTRSSASMTGRTFREQSPVRTHSTAHLNDITPIPPIPQQYAISLQHRRTTNLGPGYKAIPPPNVGRRARPAPNSPTERHELERNSSRGSINFSYPMNARPNSPQLSPTGTGSTFQQGSSPTPVTPAPLKQASMATVQQEKPGPTQRKKKKKKKQKPISDKPPPPNKLLLSNAHVKLATTPGTIDSIHTQTPAAVPAIVTTKIKNANSQLRHEDVLKKEGLRMEPIPQYKAAPTSRGRTESEDIRGVPSSNSAVTAHVTPKDSPTIRAINSSETNTANGQNISISSNTTTGLKKTNQLDQMHIEKSDQKSETTDIQPDQESQSSVNITKTSLKQPPLDGRRQSLSPNRYTRFSENLEIPDSDQNLHVPPPRSMSPAKPALKTPVSLQRARLPAHWRNSVDAFSETSEGTSVISDEGLRVARKKKNAKVTFEDETETAGHTLSPPTSPESPLHNGQKGSNLPWNEAIVRTVSRRVGDDELDKGLEPRPALPSFGSIREKRPSTKDADVDQNHTAKGLQLGHVHSSNDHVIGGLLIGMDMRGQPQRNFQHSNDPLPPEVTTVNGTGYSSSSEDGFESYEGADLRYFPPRISHANSYPKRGCLKKTESSIVQLSDEQVRQAQHPNPTIQIQPATPAQDCIETFSASLATTTAGDMSSDTNGAGRTNESTHVQDTSGVDDKVEVIAPVLQLDNQIYRVDQSESDDSGDSVYSDAVEDLSELDLDAFGSIDAIVDSPIAKSHVRSLSEAVEDQQLKIPAIATAINPTQKPERQLFEGRSTKTNLSFDKTRQNGTATASNFGSQHHDSSPYQNAPERTAIHGLEQNRDTQVLNRLSEQKIKSKYVQAPGRTLSQRSDSSSSIKRPGRPRPARRYTLRQSMRDGQAGGREVLSDGGIQDHLERLPSHRRPFSSGDAGISMRTTMRNPSQGSHSKSSSFAGFGKFTKSKGFPGRNRKDPAKFRSRFEDSSDDESHYSEFRPVRGIPRTKSRYDGDSTDLDDSSDNETPRSQSIRRGRPHKGTSMTHQDPAAVAAAVANIIAAKETGSMARASPAMVNKEVDDVFQSTAKKPSAGLFGRLGLSKHKRRHGDTRIQKSELESAARRDTPLERSRFELEQSKATPKQQPSLGRVASVNGRVVTEQPPDKWRPITPKLQNRLSKASHKKGPDSWASHGYGTAMPSFSPTSTINAPAIQKRGPPTPAPQYNDNPNSDRPYTSDGLYESRTRAEPGGINNPLEPHVVKPKWTSRLLHSGRAPEHIVDASSVVSDVGPSMGTMVLNREKKARFPRLKKAFGLR